MPIIPYTESDFILRSWIENSGDIICPYCGQSFRDELLRLAKMRFCPDCGHEINLKENKNADDSERN